MPWSAATGLHQEVSQSALSFVLMHAIAWAVPGAMPDAQRRPWLSAHACHLHGTKQAYNVQRFAQEANVLEDASETPWDMALGIMKHCSLISQSSLPEA